MLLAIDIGNTNTVLGAFDGEKLVDSWRVKTDSRTTADEMALQWRGLLDEIEVDGISVCSTVPAVLHEVRGLLARYYADVSSIIVEPGVKTGVPLLYDNPRELGADRIANAVAAREQFGAPVIVVDFGTSTNFDIVGPDGDFVGGVLAPGIETSMEALFSRAARLVKVDYAEPPQVIGKTTEQALRSGLVYGFAGQVDGIVDAIRGQLGAEAKAVATGGLADLIAPHSRTISHVEPFLTLEGLRLVWERNRESL